MSGVLVNAVKNGFVDHDYGNKDIDTTYNLGDGNHIVDIEGNYTNLKLGTGNSTVKAVGNNMNISTGDGDDDVLFLGDNVKLNTGDGDDDLIFWGNNCKINMGDGDDSATTFDKVYESPKYEDLADTWLNSLESGIWEKETLKNSNLIDRYQRAINHFFYTTIKTYSVYENHYDIETILSKYVNMQNTTIDMGDGDNDADVTLGDNTTIKSNGVTYSASQNTNSSKNDNINITEKYSIDETIGHRDECRIITDVDEEDEVNLMAVLGLSLGLGLCSVAATTVGIVGGCTGN